MNEKPKVLLFDLETFPLVVETWGTYEQNALRVLRDFTICAFSAKWLDGKMIAKGLCDYWGYKPVSDRNLQVDDRKIVKDIWKLLDEADIVIAQNGDAFDVKKVNTRFLVHGLKPPSPYKTIDTLKIARNSFGFDYNKLNDLGRQTGSGMKHETGGYSLWVGCMTGDKEAWRKMKAYNRQDVNLLESVYKKFRPWAKTHPNVGIYTGILACPSCGSSKIQSRGFAFNHTTKYRRLQCSSCGKWSRDTKNININKQLVSI